MMSTVTAEGKITLPEQVRSRLGLRSGDKVDFVVREDGRVELIPVKISIRELKGIIASPIKGLSQEDYDEAISSGAASHDRD